MGGSVGRIPSTPAPRAGRIEAWRSSGPAWPGPVPRVMPEASSILSEMKRTLLAELGAKAIYGHLASFSRDEDFERVLLELRADEEQQVAGARVEEAGAVDRSGGFLGSEDARGHLGEVER